MQTLLTLVFQKSCLRPLWLQLESGSCVSKVLCKHVKLKTESEAENHLVGGSDLWVKGFKPRRVSTARTHSPTPRCLRDIFDTCR